MTDRPRFVTYVRLWTGKAVSKAHVLDRVTGEVVASCPHFHRQRRHREFGQDGARKVTGGVVYAERCAERLLQQYIEQRVSSSHEPVA